SLAVAAVSVTSRRRHTTSKRDWSSDVCSSDLEGAAGAVGDVAGDDLADRDAARLGVRLEEAVEAEEEVLAEAGLLVAVDALAPGAEGGRGGGDGGRDGERRGGRGMREGERAGG